MNEQTPSRSVLSVGWRPGLLARANQMTARWALVGQVLLLAAGLAAIAHATGLERTTRPPSIGFGLPSVAIALAVAAPAVWALTYPRCRTRRFGRPCEP